MQPPNAGTARLCALAMACVCATGGGVPVYGYRVVRVYPHDRTAFTQGLVWHDGYLYEGTGLKGRSSLRKVDLQTGRVLQETDLASFYFGEGIAITDGRVVQLTWQSHTGFVYDLDSFRPLQTFRYPGEGWGLTSHGGLLYMSDGTDEIRVWDSRTLEEQKRLRVRDGRARVPYLNELEYVDGEIYANVWQSDRIARISPRDGHVIAWIDLSGILPESDRAEPVDVLNGIAWDHEKRRLFVTGKLWPKLFEIEVISPAKR